jgi:hypothetical protein
MVKLNPTKERSGSAAVVRARGLMTLRMASEVL